MCRLRRVRQPEHHSAGSAGAATLLSLFQAGFFLVPFPAHFPPSTRRTRTSRVFLTRPPYFQVFFKQVIQGRPWLEQSVDKVALQARYGVPSRKYVTIHPPIHPVWRRCLRWVTFRRSPCSGALPAGRFGEGAKRGISAARAGRSPDGLCQRAANPRVQKCGSVLHAGRLSRLGKVHSRPFPGQSTPVSPDDRPNGLPVGNLPAEPQFVCHAGGCSCVFRGEVRFQYTGEH